MIIVITKCLLFNKEGYLDMNRAGPSQFKRDGLFNLQNLYGLKYSLKHGNHYRFSRFGFIIFKEKFCFIEDKFF